MKEIKFLIPENGEKLAKVDDIHAELLKIPAEMYIALYHMMKIKMENSYPISSGYISPTPIPSGGFSVSL